ncbi:hypothetical protein HPB51_029413 [Rhipicephalus microplus]|uniref:LIM zinc-binding domain-containing protein n=1 Tax=Rhipicephalus microplus TaxID=6941 RepID=A0A9J6CUF6_RHIMP|nr:hypothetical protein HPB51_029413 [Rhipicephalus microplus]
MWTEQMCAGRPVRARSLRVWHAVVQRAARWARTCTAPHATARPCCCRRAWLPQDVSNLAIDARRCSPAPSTCSSGSWSLVTARSPSQVGASSRSSSLGYGGGEVCARCRDTVYFAERQVGTAGRVYHVRCFRCRACEQRLASGSYRSEGGELYCEPCHRRHLGPRGYGYGLGSALRCFPGRL